MRISDWSSDVCSSDLFDRGIFADAADISSAVANAFYRRDVTTILTLVDEHDARRFTQDGLSLLRRNLVFELDIDRFGMANEDRHANAGGGELDCRVQYLLGFHHHLPFFLGRSIVQEDAAVGDDVEGNLLAELLGLRRVADRSEERRVGNECVCTGRYR